MSVYAPGKYRLKVVAANLGETKGGKGQIELTCQVLSAYDPDTREPVAVDGPDRIVFLTLTEATLGTPEQPGWVWLTLMDLGFVGPSFSDLEPLKGQVRYGRMHTEEHEGKTREKWELFRRGGGAKPAAVQVVKSLDNQFSRLLKGAPKGGMSGGTPAPAAQTPQAPRQPAPARPSYLPPEEDIPF